MSQAFVRCVSQLSTSRTSFFGDCLFHRAPRLLLHNGARPFLTSRYISSRRSKITSNQTQRPNASAATDDSANTSKQVDSDSEHVNIIGEEYTTQTAADRLLVQDLPIPQAPFFHGRSAKEMMQHLEVHLVKQNVSARERREILEKLGESRLRIQAAVSDLVDKALPMLTDTTGGDEQPPEEAVDAFMQLLQLAGFNILPQFVKLDPPSADALQLGVADEQTLDPTILRRNRVVRERFVQQGLRPADLGEPEHYPYIFAATRGVSLVKKSGLLLPLKLRALERKYFGWMETPFALVVNPIRRIFRPNANDERGQDEKRDATSTTQGYVRRVVPAVKLEMNWQSLKQVLQPSFTQEPAHSHLVLVYRSVRPSVQSVRRSKRAALLRQMRGTLMELVRPTPTGRRERERAARNDICNALDALPRGAGELDKVRVELFTEVGWGVVHHVYPGTYVLPATRDLLRIDVVTFSGLLSALVTHVRDVDSVFVAASLAASFVSYVSRVGFGWRSALMAYRKRIAEEKGERRVASGEFCIRGLAGLAADEGLFWAAWEQLGGADGVGEAGFNVRVDEQTQIRELWNQLLNGRAHGAEH